MKLSKSLLTAFTLLTINVSAYATKPPIIIAPTCLAKHLNSSSQTVLGHFADYLLIQTNEAGIDQLNEYKHKTGVNCGGFIDVSAQWYHTERANLSHDGSAFLSQQLQHQPRVHSPYSIHYPSDVNQLLSTITPQAMWENLTTLSNFPDRYSNSVNGVKATEWMKSTLEAMAQAAGRHDVSVYLVATGENYKQPSVVMKIGDSNQTGVLLGAHIDTTNGRWQVKPGADDDGSGSVTALEVARVIINSGKTFKKPIYFAWYAAEEMGLVGSQYVVRDFKNKNIAIDAVMHFDMTGFEYKNEPTMYLMDDYVDNDLSQFTETLIKTYVKQAVKHSQCGYACSDHASWWQAGIRTTMPAEAAYEHTNPVMHSSNDTMERLSLDHMTDYAKLGVAFVVELGEPIQ